MTSRCPSALLIVLVLLATQASDPSGSARAATPPQAIQIGTSGEHSRVPAPHRQGTGLPAQSISALDVSDDGRFIAVGTMAFRHDRNFWLLSAETGDVNWGRYVETWAPAQVRALAEGKGFTVGLTYGPITSVGSTVGLIQNEKEPITYAYDWPLVGGRGWLRYGSGDWRTGWPASIPADLFTRAGEAVFASADANNSRSVFRYGSGKSQSLGANRPFRMAASADGKLVALGYAVHDFRGVEPQVAGRFFDSAPHAMVSIRSAAD